MNALANVYNYSKGKSGTMFNYRKSKVENEKKKKETSWIQLFYTKYEETKNTSYLYIMNLGNIMKNDISRIWVYLSFLKFNGNPKYMNLTWYKRVYYMLKDQIYQFIKGGNTEISETVPVAQNENDINEMKSVEQKGTEENTIHDKFVKYDSAVHSFYSQSQASKLFSKYNGFFKRTNSECINEKENNFPVERKLAVGEDATSRYRTVSLFNGFMPFRNNFTSLSETNGKVGHVTEKAETVSINEEHDTTTIADKASDNASDKDYETATSEPVTAEHNATDSVNTDSVNTEPVATEPIATDPIATKPIATEPIATEPIATEPIATEPVVTEPVSTEIIVTEPVATEPVTETVATESVPKEPATTELIAEEPNTSKADTTEESAAKEISATPRKNSGVADLNDLTNNIKKNLNIKGAWTKLSNFIA